MQYFNNKTVFITGGASGIGLETGRQLAALGASIVIFDLRPAPAAVAAIMAARRSDAQTVQQYQFDVSRRQEVIDVMGAAVAACGTPDIVINSAGIGITSEFVSARPEDFDRTMQINVYGSRHVCEAVVPFMRARGQGQIVLLASMGGVVSIYGYTSYSTSKFAVRGFAEALRYELKPMGIGVTCVCPGEVDTPMVASEGDSIPAATRALKDLGGTMSVEVAVRELVAGIARNKQLLVLGYKSRVSFWMHRLTPPSLWYALTDAIVARALRKQDAR